MHSSGSGFFLSLGAQCSSEAEQGPPDALSSAPPPSPSSCLTTPFGRFFREPRWKHLPPAPWFEVQGVPCFKSNGRSSSADTEARRPVLLSRDVPQGREARFSHNGETRPKVLPIEELSWLHTERREEGIQAPRKLQINFFVEKTCEACLAGGK